MPDLPVSLWTLGRCFVRDDDDDYVDGLLSPNLTLAEQKEIKSQFEYKLVNSA